MAQPRVDYDRLAGRYNERFQEETDVRGVELALRQLLQEQRPRRLLEVGCGTSRWLAALAPYGGQTVGVDLSMGMLRQARRRGQGLQLVQGVAAALPFPDDSFDFIYAVNAIHHFQQPRRFVREARRLLRPGGALAISGMDPRQQHRHWYVYDYFPGTYERDLARFPTWGALLDWGLAAGFRQARWRVVEEIADHKVGAAVLDDPFLRQHNTSQLALLSEEAYEAGLARIRAELARAAAAGEETLFQVDLLLSMLVFTL